ncbi:MAG: sugar phosphate isomerase/epimerase, partial [Clostridia bacterium]|nr:sugar phosphate isomerase/epimerase [Clostridia bacterium]
MRNSIETDYLLKDLGTEEYCKLVSESGFTALNFDLCNVWNSGEMWHGKLPEHSVFEEPLDNVIKYYQPQLDAFKKYGLSLGQAHAPYPACLPDRPEAIMPYAIKIYKRMIEFCSKVGIPYLVIHGVSLYEWDKNNSWEDIEKLNIELFSALIPELKGSGVTACMENLPYPVKGIMRKAICCYPEQAVKLIDALNEMAGEEVFGFCLDIGHLNLCRNDTREFILTLGKRLKCLHVHDNYAEKDDHRAPYSGNIDWEWFLAALADADYQGDMSFETFHQYASDYLPKELIPAYVKFIGDAGNYFIKKI